MATYSKLKLSGSTDGKQVKVAAIGSPGTTIHTAHATDLDEVWIYAVNSSSTTVKLTIEWGETAAPDGNVEVSLIGEAGYSLIVPGLVLTNSLVIRAFADSANVILINGFVNRITP